MFSFTISNYIGASHGGSKLIIRDDGMQYPDPEISGSRMIFAGRVNIVSEVSTRFRQNRHIGV